MKRPCIDCGVATEQTRCPSCKLPERPKPSRPHYRGDYARRAATVRASATICWLCGQPAKPDDPWTADHLIPGEPSSPLLPAHRTCNSRRGNKPDIHNPGGT